MFDAATMARIERMILELSVLNDNLRGLTTFINSREYFELPQIDQDDLLDQQKAMQKYHVILSRRIARNIQP